MRLQHLRFAAELVQPFIKNGGKCIEVFARYLVPGWTSVGNEVLKLQHESFYEPSNHEPSAC